MMKSMKLHYCVVSLLCLLVLPVMANDAVSTTNF